MAVNVANFEEMMLAVSKFDVDMAKYLTPVNFEEAKAEFLADSSLRYPKFEYADFDFRERFKGLSELNRDYQVHMDNILWPRAQWEIFESYLAHIRHNLNVLNTMKLYRRLRTKCNASAHVLQEKRDRLMSLNDQPVYELFYRQIMDSFQTGRDKPVGFVPKPETVKNFADLIKEHWGKSFERVDFSRKEYTAEEVCDLVNLVITEDYGFETDFRAVVNEQKKGLSVNQIDHRLEIPTKRSNGPYTPKTVYVKVLGHENTHVYRAAHVGYPVLALKLPEYGTFEEGVTECVERALNSKYTPNGKWHYVALGSALYDGLDFRDTYERCLKIEDKYGFGGLDVFNVVQRSFRGTGDIPWTAGAVYLNGPQIVWRLIEAMSAYPNALWSILFESGKTNVLDRTHRNLLTSYGWSFADFMVQIFDDINKDMAQLL